MEIDTTAIKFLLTLRYNPFSKKEYKIQTEVPSKTKSIDLALSSGIDSHYVLHTLRQERPDLKINCICVDFVDGKNEWEKARALAKSYDAALIWVLIDDPLQDLEKYIKIVGEPRWNLYQHFLYEQCQSKTLVTGDGGDEVFAGYTFRYKKFRDNYKNNAYVIGQYLDCHQRDWVDDQNDIFRDQSTTAFMPVFNYLDYWFGNTYTDPMDLLLMADRDGKLMHDFLPSNHKLSQHAGIQLITPLLKHKLGPWQELYDPVRNLGKLPLRKVINRWDDTKLGFGFDAVKYWNRIGKEKIQPVLEDGEIFKEIINKDWYISHKDSEDVRYINKFLQLYALELYLNSL